MHKLVKKEVVNGVIITEPDKHGTHISRIDLTFTKQDGKLLLKDKTATVIPEKHLTFKSKVFLYINSIK